MKTNHLAPLYKELTPGERLRLLMAAWARGDTAEQKNLSARALTRGFEVPDYYPLAKALGQAVHFHMLTLLDLAAHFWQWWGLWKTDCLRSEADVGASVGRRQPATMEPGEHGQGHRIARYYASQVVAHVDGWKHFCTDLQIDPELQLRAMIGWGMITQTESAARAMAFSPEEAALFVAMETVPVEGDDSVERGPAPVETVEGLAQAWHVILEEFLDQEGGSSSDLNG